MIFNSRFIKILLRVTILISWVFALVYSYLETDLAITPFMFGLLILISVIELTLFLQRQERNWIEFLESIKYHDFNRAYKNYASKELSNAYEMISQSMEELQSDNQAEYRLLQTVLGHVSIGVACYQENGNVVFTNKSFDTLLEVPGLVHTDKLKSDYPLIYQVMTKDEVNPAGWIDHKNGQKLFVKTESFKLKGVRHSLVSLTDIRSSLDAKELESYQKLMRVMTHEIMNSTNPILSLIKVINKKLIKGDQLIQLTPKDQRNVTISLNAIEERTSGILKFVSAYKEINASIDPLLEKIGSKDLLASVASLMSSSDKISYETNDNFKEDLFIDLSMINQVLINLIKNATEALNSIENGLIILSLKRDENKVLIEVSDNGPGVPNTNIHQIFVPFFTTKDYGSGIGLALSRKIIKAHGGTLEYDRNDGLSTFIIRLPINKN